MTTTIDQLAANLETVVAYLTAAGFDHVAPDDLPDGLKGCDYYEHDTGANVVWDAEGNIGLCSADGSEVDDVDAETFRAWTGVRVLEWLTEFHGDVDDAS